MDKYFLSTLVAALVLETAVYISVGLICGKPEQKQLLN